MPTESNTGLETLSAKCPWLLSQFKLAPWVMEAPTGDKEKALLKARGVIKVGWCDDESERRAPLQFPANVTLSQTRRDVWLLLLTGLKESRAQTKVKLTHATAKNKIKTGAPHLATSLCSVAQTQATKTCIQVLQSGSNQELKM